MRAGSNQALSRKLRFVQVTLSSASGSGSQHGLAVRAGIWFREQEDVALTEERIPRSVMRPTTASPDALVISAVRSTLLGSNTSSEPTLPFVICIAQTAFRKGAGDGRDGLRKRERAGVSVVAARRASRSGAHLAHCIDDLIVLRAPEPRASSRRLRQKFAVNSPLDLARVRVSRGSRKELIPPRLPQQTAQRTFCFNMSVIFVWPQPCLAVAFVGSSSGATAAAPSACQWIADVLTCGPNDIGAQPPANAGATNRCWEAHPASSCLAQAQSRRQAASTLPECHRDCVCVISA